MAAVRHAKDIHNDSLSHPGSSVKLVSFELYYPVFSVKQQA